ncbi:hypothetical protein J4437_06280 [Candidatus Woesearchaeota archaeon]|nr:hypothetical protein [Candidatus Woesearchaeota archaeon]
MVSYQSSSSGYISSSSNKSYSTNTSGAYTVKSNSSCCGSFSRGQRCMGCPGA